MNIDLSGNEIPLGLGAIAALLFSVAGINLITKQVATVSGVAFTLIFSPSFSFSERMNKRKETGAHVERDKFRLQPRAALSNESVSVRPGNTLCFVRDYNSLAPVSKALASTDATQKNLVVVTVHITKGPHAGYEDIREDSLFTRYEELLFTRVVALAEKVGKPVSLLVVPSSNFAEAAARTAAQLDSAKIIVGRSSVTTAEGQLNTLTRAWEELTEKPRHPLNFLVVGMDGESESFIWARVRKFSKPSLIARKSQDKAI